MGGKIKCFQDKVKLKEFIITKTLLYECQWDLSKKKKKIKNMNSKMTTNSQLSTTEPKQKQKQKRKKQSKLEQNRITEMEITWKVISREGEQGEWGKRYRE